MRTYVLGIVSLVVLGLVAVLYSFVFHTSVRPAVVCTQEAMQCPDGSYVGRTGPDCQFAACPGEASPTAPVVGEGEHCGGFIQNAPVCGDGFHCQLNVSMPDTGGTCVSDTNSAAGFAPYHSGVHGTVTLSGGPYATLVVLFRASDPVHAYAFSQSADDGTFSFSVPPGNYVVGAGESNTPECSHIQVTVPAQGYADAAVSCSRNP